MCKKFGINLCNVLTLFQGYLEVKIFNRMKKIQKPKHSANPAEAGPSKAKRQKKDFSIWAQQPDLPAGETLATLKAFAEENRNEVRRNPRKHKAHKDFMDKTFPLRRHEIITAPKLVKAVLMEYPSLKYFIHVSICCKLLVSVINVNQLQVCLFVCFLANFWLILGYLSEIAVQYF